MRMRSLYALPLLLVIAAVAVASCDRRDIEVYASNINKVRVEIDWETMFGSVPSGMTLLFYADGASQPTTAISNNVRSHTVYLEPGSYRLLVHNLTNDEFGTLDISGTESYGDALVTAQQSAVSDTAAWDYGSTYIKEPESIGVMATGLTVHDDGELEEDNINFYDYRQRHLAVGDTVQYVVRDTVYPMTTTLDVLVHVGGIQNMRSMAGNLSGMADGFYMTRIWRKETSGTVQLSEWTRTAADTVAATRAETTDGWMQARVKTYGLPHGKETQDERTAEDNVVTLFFTLRDGSTRTFTYEVGKYIHYVSNITSWEHIKASDVALEVVLVIDAPLDYPVLPDVEDNNQGSGFSAEVEDWQNGGTVDVGL